MKKIFVPLVLMLALSFGGRAQMANNSISPTTAQRPEIITVREYTHDFGKIPQGRPATYTFQITNISNEPLRLEDVRASCGCTTPEWSKEPIAQGANSDIKVGYNAYAEGHFNKTVTIFFKNHQTKTINITGEVYKAPTTSAPDNASVQLLNQINQ